MNNYREILDKVKGDMLLIGISKPLKPLTGLASIIDWRLDSLLSRLITKNRFALNSGQVLMLHSAKKTQAERTVIIDQENTELHKEIYRITKDMKCTDFSLSLSAKNKINTKNLFSDLKNNGLKWKNIKTHTLDNEELYNFEGVTYE